MEDHQILSQEVVANPIELGGTHHSTDFEKAEILANSL